MMSVMKGCLGVCNNDNIGSPDNIILLLDKVIIDAADDVAHAANAKLIHSIVYWLDHPDDEVKAGAADALAVLCWNPRTLV